MLATIRIGNRLERRIRVIDIALRDVGWTVVVVAHQLCGVVALEGFAEFVLELDERGGGFVGEIDG